MLEGPFSAASLSRRERHTHKTRQGSEQAHLIRVGHLATTRNVVVFELGYLGIGQFLPDHTVDPALERWPLQTQGLDLRVGPSTPLSAVLHDEFTSDFHDAIVRRSHRVPIDVFPGAEDVRDPARRAQPAAHTTRVWTGPTGCPVAPSSPRLCLRPDAAYGLAEDSLKRRRRQGVRKTKQPTASSQIPW